MTARTTADRFFTQQERGAIEDAVRSVERDTSGEIAVMIVDASDAEAPAREFSTGSVGYGLSIRETQFKK